MAGSPAARPPEGGKRWIGVVTCRRCRLQLQVCTERDKGTLYELFYSKEGAVGFRHVTLFRPFGPLMKVRSAAVDLAGTVVGIVVPLSGRTEAFSQFLHNFREVCVQHDRRVHLTVVYFGQEGLREVKSSSEKLSRLENFSNYTLIPVDEEFSRGRGLDIGAHAWGKGDVLMFFCDVDIYFTPEFLNTCRLNTSPGTFTVPQLNTLSIFSVLLGAVVGILKHSRMS